MAGVSARRTLFLTFARWLQASHELRNPLSGMVRNYLAVSRRSLSLTFASSE